MSLGISALSLFLLSCAEPLQSNRPYVLTTATTGGTYYPVGVALATITKSRLQHTHGISLAAISSAGSLENIKLLRDNQAQFALLQGIFAAWAWRGEGPISKPQPNLRSVSAMWQNVEHFALLTEHVRGGTIADLAHLNGERFVLGARNSGAEQTGRYILDQLKIDYARKFNLAYMGYGATADAIQDGNIVGMNIPAGAPVSAITRAFAILGEDISLLGFTEEELAAINGKYPLWDFYDFPAGTYPNQTRAVRSIAHPNVLAVNADVPEEVVYQITKTIWENLSALNDIHKATRDMKFEIAIKGLGAPLHPGAIRYYRERGLQIPAELIVDPVPEVGTAATATQNNQEPAQ
ncbi:TAXI family TRAP transporter solute-binding subunit [Gilvimarinus sp. F26214L]|uniref:TAXI family TRAP transporter solute-binding subunit n=1 Tax=Gilvimarinus sp. DZF01 TaxID=3461371 RepID=UPI00404543B7